jgi:hypothetical protein
MDKHSITPPPELVQQWAKDRALLGDDTPLHLYIANRASQYGADQELEACCEWLEEMDCDDPQETARHLRAARRPKPPSLKEQAFEAQQRLMTGAWRAEDWQLIDRALEALPE